MNKAELQKDMDDLWANFLQVRATYPYARPNALYINGALCKAVKALVCNNPSAILVEM